MAIQRRTRAAWRASARQAGLLILAVAFAVAAIATLVGMGEGWWVPVPIDRGVSTPAEVERALVDIRAGERATTEAPVVAVPVDKATLDRVMTRIRADEKSLYVQRTDRIERDTLPVTARPIDKATLDRVLHEIRMGEKGLGQPPGRF